MRFDDWPLRDHVRDPAPSPRHRQVTSTMLFGLPGFRIFPNFTAVLIRRFVRALTKEFFPSRSEPSPTSVGHSVERTVRGRVSRHLVQTARNRGSLFYLSLVYWLFELDRSTRDSRIWSKVGDLWSKERSLRERRASFSLENT